MYIALPRPMRMLKASESLTKPITMCNGTEYFITLWSL
jgi:hypothetical protein